jgi:hypothetical protein
MASETEENQLELSISTEKESYCLDEPVYLIARLSNPTASPLPVLPPRIEPSGIPSNIGLLVKSKAGATLQPVSREMTGGVELTGGAGESIALEPGRNWVVVVDMLAAYGKGKDRGTMVFRRGRLPRGEYEIEAFYRSSYARAGIIRSNTVTISVGRVPPWEWMVHRLLLKAHSLYRSERSDEQRRQAVLLYEKIIRKHRKSRYLSDAYRMFAELSRDEDASAIKDAVYAAQAQFADPALLYNLLMGLEETPRMAREELMALLRQLFWRAPGSTFSEIVKQRLTFEEMIARAANAAKKDETARAATKEAPPQTVQEPVKGAAAEEARS